MAHHYHPHVCAMKRQQHQRRGRGKDSEIAAKKTAKTAKSQKREQVSQATDHLPAEEDDKGKMIQQKGQGLTLPLITATEDVYGKQRW